MTTTLTIDAPDPPAGWKIIDCRPPKKCESYLGPQGRVCWADADFGTDCPYYILRRKWTDEQRWDAVVRNKWAVVWSNDRCRIVDTLRGDPLSKYQFDPRAAINEAMDKAEQT